MANMMTNMRTLAAVLAVFLTALAIGIGGSAAETYPSRIVKVIVPFPAGGVLDAITRSLTERMPDKIGQPVIAENRGGAGGTVGLEACSKSAPDGYTLCTATIEQTSIRASTEPDQFARYKDLMPITQLVSSQGVLFVNPALGVHDLDGLIRLARERPGKLNYGSFGWGSAPQVVYEWLKAEKGIDIFHVPLKGAGDMMTEIVSGRIDAGFVTVGFAKPYVNAGKITPLAVVGRARSALLPAVPSLAELGFDCPYHDGWFALMGPPGIHKPALDKIVAAVRGVLGDADYKQKFLDPLGYVPIGNSPQAFAATLKDETARFAPLMKFVQSSRRY